MKLKCPKCLFSIEKENINYQKKTAVCISCHHFFYTKAGEEQKDKNMSYKKVNNTPKGFSSIPSLSGLEIKIKTRYVSGGMGQLLFGVLFLIMPSLFLYLSIVSPEKITNNNGPYMTGFMLAIFIAVALWMIVDGILKIITVTTIKMDDETLEVSSSPISIGRYETRRYPIKEIEQIFVRKYSEKSNDGDPIYEYAVDFLSSKGGKTAWIMKGLSKPNQAWYLEQKLERHLNLQDKHIIGEFDPSDEYSPSIREQLVAMKRSVLGS